MWAQQMLLHRRKAHIQRGRVCLAVMGKRRLWHIRPSQDSKAPLLLQGASPEPSAARASMTTFRSERPTTLSRPLFKHVQTVTPPWCCTGLLWSLDEVTLPASNLCKSAKGCERLMRAGLAPMLVEILLKSDTEQVGCGRCSGGDGVQ